MPTLFRIFGFLRLFLSDSDVLAMPCKTQAENKKPVRWLGLRILSFLHQPFHFTHFPLEETMHADLATVGVECDGGEASNRGVDLNA